jgi:cell division transport system ATP-binding protein
LIRFENVHKRYPTGCVAVRGVFCALVRGEMDFIPGPSGAGKSSLLKLITLIEKPSRGTVLVNSQNTSRVTRRRIPRFRQKVGVVFQDHKLLYDRSVFDNVALPLVIIGLGPREIARRVRASLDQVGLLGRERHDPMTLSTGEQQRVGIARAVSSRPDVVVADEPTGNLDPELSLEIMRLFERFNEVGVTLLIATHDLDLIGKLDRRRLRLLDGQIDRDTPRAGNSAGSSGAGAAASRSGPAGTRRP